jgi:hypothetical protein
MPSTKVPTPNRAAHLSLSLSVSKFHRAVATLHRATLPCHPHIATCLAPYSSTAPRPGPVTLAPTAMHGRSVTHVQRPSPTTCSEPMMRALCCPRPSPCPVVAGRCPPLISAPSQLAPWHPNRSCNLQTFSAPSQLAPWHPNRSCNLQTLV